MSEIKHIDDLIEITLCILENHIITILLIPEKRERETQAGLIKILVQMLNKKIDQLEYQITEEIEESLDHLLGTSASLIGMFKLLERENPTLPIMRKLREHQLNHHRVYTAKLGVMEERTDEISVDMFRQIRGELNRLRLLLETV